jgi:hypothetical protein
MSRVVHTGPESYQELLDAGLDVQPVHAGMSRFANPTEAWDLWWRPEGWSDHVRVSVGDVVDAATGTVIR